MTGIVKWFNGEKGFGFIFSEELKQDIFVHASDVSEKIKLVDGQHVEFETEQGHKGLKAKNVVVKPKE